MRPTIDKESAFAEVVKEHEDQWVAIIEKDGIESVVGSGSTAVEAVKEAATKGYPQTMLFRVPSFSTRFVH